MATKRRPLHSYSKSELNFRPNVSDQNSKLESKGSKPLPEPSSVQKVILTMILHLCRKIVFFDTTIKISIYLVCLFAISLLADQFPFPKTYLAQKTNIFNVYFVKVAWGWTLLLAVPFVTLTSSTYCCGKQRNIINHLIRLAIATVVWYFWVNMFLYLESIVGSCKNLNNATVKKFKTRYDCLQSNNYWQGFDTSGHTFILIYSSLVLIEEARVIMGWDGIEDMLRNEDYNRTNNITDVSSPLRNLSKTELKIVNVYYKKHSPYIKGIFILITFFIILWDMMLISTVLYFHNMYEKLLSGIIAISMWFLTYKCLYTIQNYYLPRMPGEGSFRYKESKSSRGIPLAKKGKPVEKRQIPKFMGMPLVGLQNDLPNEKTDKSSILGSDNGFGSTHQT